MRKAIVMLVVIMVLSGHVIAKDYKVEIKGSYFTPSKTIFKEIYGGGMMYGFEASRRIWKGLNVWMGMRYFSKLGELTYTKERTRLGILTYEIGLRYSQPVHKNIEIYGGLGIDFNSYKESNIIGKVSKGGTGIETRIGSYVKVVKGFLIDAFFLYSNCNLKPADFKVQIGGIEVGFGLGYEF